MLNELFSLKREAGISSYLPVKHIISRLSVLSKSKVIGSSRILCGQNSYPMSISRAVGADILVLSVNGKLLVVYSGTHPG